MDGMTPSRPTGLPTGTVTFLFTDVEGSTRLAAALGPRFAAVLDRHHAILRGAFIEAAGTEVSTEGDAFFHFNPLGGRDARGCRVACADAAHAADGRPIAVAV